MKTILAVILTAFSFSATAATVTLGDIQGTWSSCVSHQDGWSYLSEINFIGDQFASKAAVYQSENCQDRMIDEQVATGFYELLGVSSVNAAVNDLNLLPRDLNGARVYGVVKLENEDLCISEMVDDKAERPTDASCDLHLKKKTPAFKFGSPGAIESNSANFSASAKMSSSGSFSASANLCSKYQGRTEHMKAINVVAKSLGLTEAAICSKADVVDIEAMLSQKINEQGETIPHIRVQLHRAYDSCLFMVSRENWTITEQRCFQTW